MANQPGALSPPVALTIAGFDPTAGAGIAADLKTFAAHGCYGVAAITALTVQGGKGVKKVDAVSAELLRAQVEELMKDVSVAAVKIGMLATRANVAAVAEVLEKSKFPIVLDPVRGELAFERSKEPMDYAQAAREADQRASADSKLLLRRLLFRAWGIRLGEGVDNDPLYDAPGQAPISFEDLSGSRK